ncbi:divalent metal cation transporter [Arenibacter sp. F26102]|uniref:divalent metal cation transporter n=1 Tax=Arenibacter sp. F26102 TaxID=2926416 RepID=UPI001FF18182|nr:divalent metal cation transporter [Arenibacter sp. F26102]MCK0147169.1 divalent metal cation transporter [Arenibacter sp. F26102]
MPTPTIKEGSKIKRYLKKIGPGIITAALVFGSGCLTIYAKLGTSFWYSLLWVLILTVILMAAFTKMSDRIGLDSSVSFFERIKYELGKPLGFCIPIIVITDSNTTFSMSKQFLGGIAGIHKVLRQQGPLEGIWYLDPNEKLSPGQ